MRRIDLQGAPRFESSTEDGFTIERVPADDSRTRATRIMKGPHA